MFRRTLIFFSFFFIVTCALAYWDHIRIRTRDHIAYETFVKDNTAQRARHALENHPATQNREKVQKDFWIMQNHQRQHMRILSQQSELIVHERKGKLEAVEKLKGLECWFQEAENRSILQMPQVSEQEVRHLTAQEGIYFYPTHHFIAQTVQLQFFRLPGHDLPSILDPKLAFFSGTAKEASFSACGKSPTFNAVRLQASFDPAKGLP
jgi:hypothetical protein